MCSPLWGMARRRFVVVSCPRTAERIKTDDSPAPPRFRPRGDGPRRRRRVPRDAARPRRGRPPRDHQPARRRGVARPLRRHRPPHRRARGMDVRLREGPPLLAREPRAGRVRAQDALRDCLPQAQPPRHGGVSARGGGRRLDGRPRRRGRDRLRPPPLRLGRAPRTAESRPRRPGVLHRPVRHAVALRPRGEGLRGPRERPARVPGRAERAVPDRRHLLDQAGQGAARLQPQRAGRTRLRGLREAQQLPVRRA